MDELRVIGVIRQITVGLSFLEGNKFFTTRRLVPHLVPQNGHGRTENPQGSTQVRVYLYSDFSHDLAHH